MHNYQNDLQNLEMDSYQVGELTPVSYSDDPRCLVLVVLVVWWYWWYWWCWWLSLRRF